MDNKDIDQVAQIASQCFSGMKQFKSAKCWVNCNFRAFPRFRYFVAKDRNLVLGYILWLEKGGFRDQAVLELEQIATSPSYRNGGLATRLINESLSKIQNELRQRGSTLKIIEITTGAGNEAQNLYKRALHAKSEYKIKDFFRQDEVLMIARF
jgi:ribosomal protein S18 acetylase RimI-like enzyme